MWTQLPLFVTESRRCHPRVSRRNAEAGANWLIWGYLWTSLRASWLTVSSVGGNAFTRWEIYTIPLPLHWFCPSDLSDGFGISSAACLPQCPSPCYYNIRWRRGGEKNIWCVFKEGNVWITAWTDKHMHTFWNKPAAMTRGALSWMFDWKYTPVLL